MEYIFHIIIMLNIYIMLTLSANLTIGMANLLTMCQAAFYGIGAYIGTYFLMQFNLPFVVIAALVMLLTAVELLRQSGAMMHLTRLLAPAAGWLGIPAETVPLLLIRPLSDSAALAVGADLMSVYGPDSPVGRTAAIMLGSTETTFYTVSVYFAAAGIKKTRYAIPAALIADLTGFAVAALTARLL